MFPACGHVCNIPVVLKLLLTCTIADRNSYKTLLKHYSSNTVNLVWIKSSTRELQWVQSFKLIILELPNVWFRMIIANPVTYIHRVSVHK